MDGDYLCDKVINISVQSEPCTCETGLKRAG